VRFIPTSVAGAFVIEPESIEDERGHFARVFCAEVFVRRGLIGDVAQCSISVNRTRGTLRGMHFQAAPHSEVKVVRCTKGAIHDVLFDARPESETYLAWTAHELTPHNRHSLYVPKGVAHGFLTLVDDTEVYYQISTPFVPDAARGIRWDDPAFGANWPFDPIVISSRDASWRSHTS